MLFGFILQSNTFLQKSESSLISVIIAEGSTNALPVSTSIPADFCIPVTLYNKNVLLRCPITGESDYCPRSFRKMPHRRGTDILNRLTEYCSELYNYKANGDPSVLNCPRTDLGWPPHPSQRSGGCSTIIEEREVSWSWQYPSRTGPSRWRGCDHRCPDNLQQDLADRRMANPIDPVPCHYTSQERQPAAVPELPSNKPHQSLKQSHA